MTVIQESDMEFGFFRKEDVFQIENSSLHRSFGEGIKTVEFLLLKDNDKLLFVEAKKTCPNRNNKDESPEKTRKFEEYFEDVSDKFIDSLQMLLNVVVQRKTQTSGMGANIGKRGIDSDIKIYFILVIKEAEDVAWLVGPKEELDARLLRWKKLWNVDIVVLNETLAAKYGLVQKK